MTPALCKRQLWEFRFLTPPYFWCSSISIWFHLHAKRLLHDIFFADLLPFSILKLNLNLNLFPFALNCLQHDCAVCVLCSPQLAIILFTYLMYKNSVTTQYKLMLLTKSRQAFLTWQLKLPWFTSGLGDWCQNLLCIWMLTVNTWHAIHVVITALQANYSAWDDCLGLHLIWQGVL